MRAFCHQLGNCCEALRRFSARHQPVRPTFEQTGAPSFWDSVTTLSVIYSSVSGPQEQAARRNPGFGSSVEQRDWRPGQVGAVLFPK
jgi:hypothetical protein